MAVPDFQTMMLPVLEYFGDKQPHNTHELNVFLAARFNLNAEEQKELLPSKNQPIFNNRISWAVSYLSKADLVQKVQKSVYQITEQGAYVLNDKPEKINIKFLKQFSKSFEHDRGIFDESKAQTPEEILEQNYNIINASLASELLDTIKTCSPAFFERLVVDLLTAMGYGRSIGESKVVGRSGDGGIDGIINEDKLGLESVYIQAKRWQGTVGDVEIRNFIGSLQLKGARKGVFITTSDFTRQAKDSAAMITGIKIVLIDGLTLADLMVEYNVGVSVKTSYEIKRIDSDYFEE